jgi:hypothetical protein
MKYYTQIRDIPHFKINEWLWTRKLQVLHT